MKLNLFLLLISVFPVAAGVNAQNAKLNLKMTKATIAEVFDAIEQKSDVYFFYNKEEIDDAQRVDVEFENKTLEEVLDYFEKNLSISSQFVGKNVIIKPQVGEQFGQQAISISGRVVDKNGNALPGVTVVVKGTTKGIITDGDGKYSISDVPSDATLVFSFVGMASQEIPVTGNTSINVVMIEDAIDIEEVVAIGYGTTTKRKMVGAISSLSMENMEQLPVSNVAQALQGRVPGLIVQNSGGQPGSVPNISIRGAGKPLFVIDGVVLDEDDNISFSTLNMDDIESMSFLKDAASTAVYGSRAGNGIVLITTKRGKEGALQLNYSYNFQMSQPTVMPEHMNTYEFALVQNDAAIMDGIAPHFSEEQLDIIKNHKDLNGYPDNDWYKLALKNFAPEQRHNLSLSGGDKRTNYFISLGYFDQDGILKSDAINLERINLRSNVETNFDNIGLTVGVNINANIQNTTEPSAGQHSIWTSILHTRPNYKAFNEDGTYAAGVFHPLALSDKEAGYYKTRQKFINTQLVAKWKVPGIKGLTAGVMGNYRDEDWFNKSWNLLAPQYNSDGSRYPVPKPSLSNQSGFSKKLDFETSLSYINNWGKHGVDATLVYTQSEGDGENLSASRRDYISSAVDQIFAGPSEGKDNGGNGWNSASQGYVGRVKYDFDSKYIVEFNFRYDGNDNFAPQERWGFFPSVSGAWVISDEKFMKSLATQNIFNLLKLRASSGKTGLATGVNRYGYLSVYNLNQNVYNIGNTLITGFSEGPLVDPGSLTWYTRNSLNYGVDFSSLNNRLQGSFDYFFYKTSGYLMSPEDRYTTTLGKSLPQVKSNSVQRRAGFEFSVKYEGRIKDLAYEVGLNYTRFNQLWETLATEDSVSLMNPLTRQTHQKDYWGSALISDDLYQNGAEIVEAPRRLASTETKPGDIRYVDVNGDGKIDNEDNVRIGLPSFPHATYGIDLNLSWKGWNFYSLIQGTGDRFVSLSGEYKNSEGKEQLLRFQQDYWTKDNPNAEFPRVTHTAGVNGSNNLQTSDFWIKNAKYIRLKSVQLAYDLKSSVLKNQSYIESCKIVISGTNLFTISDVMDYFDPEDSSTSGNGYPVQKVYSIGLNVKF